MNFLPKLSTLFISSIIFCLSISAQETKQYTYETVPGDPLKTQIYTLNNGLKVFLTVYDEAPRIQTNIAVRAGSKNDPSDATGLAHYFEHLMFKGTNKLGTNDFSKEEPLLDEIEKLFEKYRTLTDKSERKALYKIIDSVSSEAAKYAIPNEYFKSGSIIGATGTNAYTSFDQTVYINNIPSNQLNNWLTIEANRFSNPVIRLFHTELETVYEEKNMTLTKDQFKVYFTLLEELFKKHTYGTQSLIGSIEHLKNPSITRIKEFFDTYYTPNNMAICLSGDLDPEETIRLIDKHFGSIPSSKIPDFTFEKEDPITTPISKEVLGPDAENVTIGFRFDGAGSKDANLLLITDMILSNAQAGLIDLNLKQKQKVLTASASTLFSMDYSVEMLSGKPKEGQSLEEVKDLLLAQLELIKKGEFPDWLIEAVINDLKLKQTIKFETNNGRSNAHVSAFVNNISWTDNVNQFKALEKITKNDIIEFTKKNFTDSNYAIIYKRTGKDNSLTKVKKPKITPLKINRDEKSEFLSKIEAIEIPKIEPVFLDFKKDIQHDNLKGNIPILYIENTENETFDLYYSFDFGYSANKKYGLAVSYISYLGSDKYSAEELQQEFYKLGCSYDVSAFPESFWIELSGLSKNFDAALKLLEDFISNVKVDEEALDNMISDIIKSRDDSKLNSQAALSGMIQYGVYGEFNGFNDRLSEKALRSIKAEELIGMIKDIFKYEHKAWYYGSHNLDELKTKLEKTHYITDSFLPEPDNKLYKEITATEDEVFFLNFDVKQTTIVFISIDDKGFKESREPYARLYNEYFGSGMNSIVFQELREARGLAYIAVSVYNSPMDTNRAYFNLSYIASQSDKLNDATTGMKELINDMPESKEAFTSAKNGIIQKMRTQRITKSDILFSYEQASKRGLDSDLRKEIFNVVSELEFSDIKKFQEERIKGKVVRYLIIGNKDDIDFKVLEKLGKVNKLKLKDVYGS